MWAFPFQILVWCRHCCHLRKANSHFASLLVLKCITLTLPEIAYVDMIQNTEVTPVPVPVRVRELELDEGEDFIPPSPQGHSAPQWAKAAAPLHPLRVSSSWPAFNCNPHSSPPDAHFCFSTKSARVLVPHTRVFPLNQRCADHLEASLLLTGSSPLAAGTWLS